jgi:hypothetical protein
MLLSDYVELYVSGGNLCVAKLGFGSSVDNQSITRVREELPAQPQDVYPRAFELLRKRSIRR